MEQDDDDRITENCIACFDDNSMYCIAFKVL